VIPDGPAGVNPQVQSGSMQSRQQILEAVL
jgi:hypothetical protein